MFSRGRTRRTSLRDSAVTQLQKVFGKSKAKPANVAQRWLASLGPKDFGYDPRLPPQLIDRIAERHPHRTAVSWPKTSDPADGFVHMSWRQLATAIDRAADWLEDEMRGEPEGQIIGFLSTTKRVSIVMVVAAAKVGSTILFMSPRNSLEGQISLIDKLGARFLMTPATQLPQVKQVREARSHLRHIVVPEIEYFLDGPEPTPRPFEGTFEELRCKRFWYLHSSGTTSLPKPVGFSYGAACAAYHELACDYPEGQSIYQKCLAASDRLMVGFPLFHLAGMFYTVILSVFTGVEIVLPPEDVPINGPSVSKLCTSSKAPFITFIPPAVVEDMYKDPTTYKALVGMPLMITGGASLPQEVGDNLVRDGLVVLNAIASSETSVIPQVAPSELSDWNSFYFPKLPGHTLEHVGEDRYEMVLKRVDGPTCPSVFNNFPELDEYRTNDIFVRHPDPRKRRAWVVAGRADDVIVLLNGEKFTPVALEQSLQMHRDVVTALVFGMRRNQAALLLEPKDAEVLRSAESRQAFVDRIWPEVERANSKIAQHGRVVKSHIMLASAEKGVLRTPKGSVQRSKMYDLYAPETDALYQNRRASDVPSEGTATVIDDGSGDATTLQGLRQSICEVANLSPEDLGDDENLFMSGFDSLHATELVKKLRAGEHKDIQASTIYSHPTVRDLHAALYGTGASTRRPASKDSEASFKATGIASTVEHLSRDLPSPPKASSGKVALLTGASGGLGQHLLNIARQRYSHVYVLVRSPVTDEQRGVEGVTYLHADLTAPRLGLSGSERLQLLHSVTHILHNAWLVDFNHPLARFTDMMVGVRGLIDLALESRHSPRLWFASSIGAVQGMSSEGEAVAEKIYPINDTSDKTCVGGMGYAQSKRASELLLAKAGEVSGLRSSICRIGQIAGTSTSKQKDLNGRVLPSWQERDYMPTLLKSARHLKAVPREIGGIGRLDWTPIDHMALAIFELLEAGDGPDAEKTQVFHVTNPAANRPEWSDMLPTIRRHLACKNGKPEAIEVVDSMQAWVERLEKSAEGASREEIERNPGIKLLEFFRNTASNKGAMPQLDTSKAQEASQTLRNEPAMNTQWMESWMEEWFGDCSA